MPLPGLCLERLWRGNALFWGGGLETCHGKRWRGDSSTRRYSASPPHQSPSVPASPRGEAYVLCYVGVFATVAFYISRTGLANRLPLGGKVGRPYGPGRMRASLEGSTAWVRDAPAQGGNGISLPAVTTISPPHQSPSVPASPQGEAYVLCYVGVFATVAFYISRTGLANAFPWGSNCPGDSWRSNQKIPSL